MGVASWVEAAIRGARLVGNVCGLSAPETTNAAESIVPSHDLLRPPSNFE